MTIVSRAVYALGLAASLVAAPAMAENTATPGSTDGWSAANVTGGGTVAISGTYARPGETGSLQFTGASSASKADYVHSVTGTLGELAFNAGASISYDYYVNSASSVADHLAPALRLAFFDVASNKSGYLIYEPVYNGYTVASGVPQDGWVHADITNANFWMRAFGGPSHNVEQYNVTLDDWANGATFPGSYQLSANTLIYSLEVGIGSGWDGTFTGAVDHVNVNFGQGGTSGVSTNFEVAATPAVPEAATWAMMIAGFGVVGGSLRRRRTAVAFG